MNRLLIFLIVISLLCVRPAAAKEKNSGPGQVLTKGEAVMLLSATDFMKKKISQLISWTIGYDITKVSRVRLTPSINYVKALPRRVPPDGRTVVEVVASVDDPGGSGNISGVRADLSSIGRLSNMMLVDNGLFGDTKAGDGIYTLQTSVPSRITKGSKEIPVAVANKKGWLAMAKTNLDVSKIPVIIGAKLVPDQIRAGSQKVVTLSAAIDNPGRVEDLENVVLDLSALGYSELVLFRNDGKGGDAMAGDGVFTAQFVVPSFVAEGQYPLRIQAKNVSSGFASTQIILRVYK